METSLIWLLPSLSVLGLAWFVGSKRLGIEKWPRSEELQPARRSREDRASNQ